MNRNSIFSSKAFIISSAIFIGSGAAFIIYQQYLWSRRQKCLSAQIVQLKQQILQLEKDIKQIKEATATSSITDEVEEVFVDASDGAQEISEVNERIESESSTASPTEAFRSSGQLARFLAKVDQQMEKGGYNNLKNVVVTLTDVADKNTHNSEVLWRLAKCYFLLASEDMFFHPDSPQEVQRDLMQKAHDAASAAVQLDSQNGDAHKWLAIVIGSVTQFLPIQEQIRNAFMIKEHIQAAIKHKPGDALAHHMLGRWCYSVYMLSWMERTVAATLFAEPPTATLEEAMDCFHKAEKLSPKNSIDNALYLAKGYIAQQDYKTAMSWLKIGSSIQCSSRDDMKSQNEIQSMLTQYDVYADS